VFKVLRPSGRKPAPRAIGWGARLIPEIEFERFGGFAPVPDKSYGYDLGLRHSF